MEDLIKKLSILLADTYSLYLKTQNYHWHVTGPQFKTLHELFEMQYLALAQAVDDVAERILIKGSSAPATFKEYEQLKRIKDGDSALSANEMVSDLANDHELLVKDLYFAMNLAQETNDEATINILAARIEQHEKFCWMLNSSKEK